MTLLFGLSVTGVQAQATYFPPAPTMPQQNAPAINNNLGQQSYQSSVPSQSLVTVNDVPSIYTNEKARIAAWQVLLSRSGASVGVIDGLKGGNMTKAEQVYQRLNPNSINPNDPRALEAQLQATGGPAFMLYRITQADVDGDYVASIPADYAEKAKMNRMAYTSVAEMLAERFHIDEKYLRELNPGIDFNRPGQMIRIINPARPQRAEVTHIVADKGRKQVFGYDAQGNLVVAYPATIGSTDTPSPTGTVNVQRVAINPSYTYNPRINFTQGNNKSVLTIPPGPNGPVGSVWIALSKPTYGIHGTPDPTRIGKTSSHGCVRLTNWDAEELARLVKIGAEVRFID